MSTVITPVPNHLGAIPSYALAWFAGRGRRHGPSIITVVTHEAHAYQRESTALILKGSGSGCSAQHVTVGRVQQQWMADIAGGIRLFGIRVVPNMLVSFARRERRGQMLDECSITLEVMEH